MYSFVRLCIGVLGSFGINSLCYVDRSWGYLEGIGQAARAMEISKAQACSHSDEVIEDM